MKINPLTVLVFLSTGVAVWFFFTQMSAGSSPLGGGKGSTVGGTIGKTPSGRRTSGGFTTQDNRELDGIRADLLAGN